MKNDILKLTFWKNNRRSSRTKYHNGFEEVKITKEADREGRAIIKAYG